VEEGWSQEGLVILGEMAADDMIWREAGYKSLEEYRKNMSEAVGGFPDLRFVADKVIGEGDEVIVVWTGSGTQTGEWAGLLPTNRHVTWTGASVFRIADGKIAEMWGPINRFMIWQGLGLMPSWKEVIEEANAKQE
jgi:predicted ester cyclase